MKKIKYLLPTILIVGSFIYLSFFVKIKTIECGNISTGCEYIDFESYRNGLPQSIYIVKKQINASLIQNNYISKYKIRYNLPNKLIIDVTKRSAAFALGSREPDSWYSIVADNGFVMAVEESSSLNVLYTNKLLNSGEYVSEDTMKAYKVYKYVKPYFKIEFAQIQEDGLLLQTNEGIQAILPIEKDEKLLIGSLLVVFNRLNSSMEESIMNNRDNQKLSDYCINGCLVDFRFQNPVIKAKI